MQNRRMKYLLITCLALLILGSACDSEPEPTPEPIRTRISITPPTQVPPPEVDIELLGNTTPEKKEIRIDTVPQNNCGGNSLFQQTVARSRTIDYTIDIGETYQVSAEGTIEVGVTAKGELTVIPATLTVGGEIKSSVSVGLGVRVAKSLNHSYGFQETLYKDVVVGARERTYVEHKIRLLEIWEKGNAEIVVDGKPLEIPFAFRTDFAIELVESREVNEKCSTLTPTETNDLAEIPDVIRRLSGTGTPIPTENSALTPVTTSVPAPTEVSIDDATNLPTSTATSLPTPTATSTLTPTATSLPTPTAVPPISADNAKQITPLYHLGKGTSTDHIGTVLAVAFSPDGQIIASGSDDDLLRLWRVSDGTLLHTLSEHTGDVTSVAFSPDGQIVASSAQDDTVRLWQASDGMLQHTLAGHTSIVESVAFSPDGQTLVSGGRDNTVLLWRVSDGLKLHTLKEHTGWIKSVAFSTDGQTVLSGGRDNTVRLWQVNEGLQKNIFTGEYEVWSMALSPDGQTVALGTNQTTVQLRQVSDGTPLHTLPGHTGLLRSVAFSLDGQLLASTSDEPIVRLWKVSDGTLLGSLEGHTSSAWIHSVAFSPDGKMLASGADDGTIRLWGVR